MTAQINVHLTEGLTGDELGLFIEESKDRSVPVDTVVCEALRMHAERIRKRRLRTATSDGVRPSLLNGMPKVPA